MSNRSLAFIAALAGLLAGASLTTHRRREAERRKPAAKPEPLQTWEGEGGSVPMRTGSRTAQQVTPSTTDVSPRPSPDPLDLPVLGSDRPTH